MFNQHVQLNVFIKNKQSSQISWCKSVIINTLEAEAGGSQAHDQLWKFSETLPLNEKVKRWLGMQFISRCLPRIFQAGVGGVAQH